MLIGTSDATGAYPQERPTTPADIHATVFAALGYVGQRINYTSADGRPILMCDGTSIREPIG